MFLSVHEFYVNKKYFIFEEKSYDSKGYRIKEDDNRDDLSFWKESMKPVRKKNRKYDQVIKINKLKMIY